MSEKEKPKPSDPVKALIKVVEPKKKPDSNPNSI